MQPKRVISFGCSHAWGSELSGRGATHHEDHYNLNYGKVFADLLELPFVREGVPGGSNELVSHLVIEKIQPNDIVVIAWTYTQRDMYFQNSDYPEKESLNYTLYEVSQIVKHELYQKNILQRFFNKFNIDVNVLNKMESELNENHGVPRFLQSITEIEKAIAKYHISYHYSKEVQFINFLRTYNLVNAYAKSKNCKVINFMFDQGCEEAKSWENFDRDYMPYAWWQYEDHQKNPIDKDFTNLNIYKDWKNDPNRIVPKQPEYYCIKHLSMLNTGYDDPMAWPDNNIGHVGPDQHKWIGEYLYKFYLDNKSHT